MVKFAQMTEEVMTKYRRIVHFLIRTHTVYVHAWKDPTKKWVPMRYKVFDIELEVDINGWPIEWRESISIEEVSIEKPTYAPEDPVRKDDHQSDDDSSTETPTNPEMQHILKEITAKKCMDQAMNSNTVSAIEAQLHRLVKVVNDATDASIK